MNRLGKYREGKGHFCNNIATNLPYSGPEHWSILLHYMTSQSITKAKIISWEIFWIKPRNACIQNI